MKNELKRIEELMEERGWTKYRLAKEAGLTPATVCGWYNGRRTSPRGTTLAKVCGAFGISEEEFYEENALAVGEKERRFLRMYEKTVRGRKKRVRGDAQRVGRQALKRCGAQKHAFLCKTAAIKRGEKKEAAKKSNI